MFLVILRSSKPKANICRNYDAHNVNRTVILYLQFHTFYNINTFKYLSTWHCTSQTDVLVLVLLCILKSLRMAKTRISF